MFIHRNHIPTADRDAQPCKPMRRGSIDNVRAASVSPKSTPIKKNVVMTTGEATHALLDYLDAKYGSGPTDLGITCADSRKERPSLYTSSVYLTPSRRQNKGRPHYLSVLANDVLTVSSSSASKPTKKSNSYFGRPSIRRSASEQAGGLKKSSSCPEDFGRYGRTRSRSGRGRMRSSTSSSSLSSITTLPTIEEFQRSHFVEDVNEEDPSKDFSVRSLPSSRTLREVSKKQDHQRSVFPQEHKAKPSVKPPNSSATNNRLLNMALVGWQEGIEHAGQSSLKASTSAKPSLRQRISKKTKGIEGSPGPSLRSRSSSIPVDITPPQIPPRPPSPPGTLIPRAA